MLAMVWGQRKLKSPSSAAGGRSALQAQRDLVLFVRSFTEGQRQGHGETRGRAVADDEFLLSAKELLQACARVGQPDPLANTGGAVRTQTGAIVDDTDLEARPVAAGVDADVARFRTGSDAVTNGVFHQG